MAGRETPATKAAREAGVEHRVHEYVHDPAADSYALEAAEALGVEPGRVFKTLVVAADGGDGGLTVCVLPSDVTLDLKTVGKRAAMAPAERAERVTGYVAGGISRSASGGGCRRSSTTPRSSTRRSSAAPAAAGSSSSWRRRTSSCSPARR